MDVKILKLHLQNAGLEIFRVRGEEVHLAERHNLQLMEAGVRARGGERPALLVVLRAQRNDAPHEGAGALFELVRTRARMVLPEGFTETDAIARELRNVSDPSQVLDLWYEVTFERAISTPEEAVELALRALSIERYILPAGA
ncbi:MAG: hypothetical protein HY909_06730 [Deltaproteobacteria bacterium]|nr:hypothetical protein [Deltaproteobacteria bacterium]